MNRIGITTDRVFAAPRASTRWSRTALESISERLLVLSFVVLSVLPAVSSGEGTEDTPSVPARVDLRDHPKASFHEGLAAVRIGDRWGYVDREGVFVIRPRFQHVMAFSEGLARVKLDDRYGYVDRNGKLVIDYLYVPAHGFENGHARVTAPDGRTGVIDHSGRFAPGRPDD
ncbi:MAG TPA: WG repeat-containing protein [Deltaproteobacteria bacterium]|nr:WG repeat-containing protein [Deltaproteobacteria bacterium]